MQSQKIKRYAQAVIPYLVIFVVILITLSYQLLNHATIVVSDTMIHFQRFYDAMMQIKTGNFSYFQTNYGLYQTGRIFNAVYGPFFAYLGGLLLMICGTWHRFQVVSVIIVFFFGAVTMYQLGLKVKTNRWVALLLSLVYMESNFISSFQKFNFMAWGAVFAPLVIMQAVNMVQDKKRPIHWIQLALIMSILAQIHLWSTFMLTITLIPFAIYGLINTPEKKRMIIDGLKAVGTALLLTANIWGAMLMLYSTNKIALPNAHNLYRFAFFLSNTENYHAAILYLMALFIVLQVIYVLFHFKKMPLSTLATGVSVAIFIVASRLMPWARLQAKYMRFGSSLQFPYRLAIGAWPLILMAIGITITQLNKKYGLVSKVITLIMLLLLVGQNVSATMNYNRELTSTYLNDRRVIKNGLPYKMPKDRVQLRKIINETNSRKLLDLSLRAQPDYLPTKIPGTNATFEHDLLRNLHNFKHDVKGDKLYVYWNSKTTKKRYLPVVMYHQSHLIVNGKEQTNLQTNGIYQPLVKSKIGKNTAILYFVAPTWFWILLWITILSWLGMLIYGIRIKLLDKKART